LPSCASAGLTEPRPALSGAPHRAARALRLYAARGTQNDRELLLPIPCTCTTVLVHWTVLVILCTAPLPRVSVVGRFLAAAVEADV
jgi:hypothetical protein